MPSRYIFTHFFIRSADPKYRIGKEWFIIMEGMVTTFPETYGGYFFAGARRTKKRFGFDLGLFVLMEEESAFYLYPYFSFSIPFGGENRGRWIWVQKKFNNITFLALH